MSNEACTGYMIIALDRCGFTKEQIEQVAHELYYVFDEKTITEAENTSLNFIDK